MEAGAEALLLNELGPYTYDVVRNLKEPAWNQSTHAIEYTEEFGYTRSSSQVREDSHARPNDGNPSAQWDANITQFNMGAWSTWHQMNAREHYWLAWQCLSQINALMLDS